VTVEIVFVCLPTLRLLKLEPLLKALEIEYVAQRLMEEGEKLARTGDIYAAVTKFEEARILVPQLDYLDIERMAALWLNKEEKEREKWWDTVKRIAGGVAGMGAVAAVIILL